MKEDIKMKDHMNAEPTGTMPHVGAMQHLHTAPNASPVHTAPTNAAPVKSPNVSPVQTAPKVSPVHTSPANSEAAQTTPNVSPVYTPPTNVAPVQPSPYMSPYQAMPNVMPNLMPSMGPNVSPMQYAPNQMPVQQYPAGVMPSMMNQAPLMCCPYLMNMQCPMTYGQNIMGMDMMNNGMPSGINPYSGNLGTMQGNMNPVPGIAGSGMNGMPDAGTMPVMNNRYFPMGGMNY